LTRSSASFLEKYRQHALPGIPRGAGQIHPFYDGYSIANLPAGICAWLGCPLPSARPLAAEFSGAFSASYSHVIFILVDGLGWDSLQSLRENDRTPAWEALLQSGQLLPLTSVAPSTTSAALTTLWTARQPAEHGIIGYEMFLKEFGLIANIILQSVSSFIGESGSLARAGFDPFTFLPVPTLGGHFLSNGIRAFALQPEPINGSGLSQMLLKDVQTQSYRSLDELWALVGDIQTSYQHSKTYTYIYWGELDTLSHQVGPGDRQVREKWDDFARGLEAFVRGRQGRAGRDTLLLLSADHGQIPTEIQEDYDLRNHPDLVSHLVMLPSGEGRLPFLFVKPGHVDTVAASLARKWGDQFQMAPAEKVLASGLLGSRPPCAETVERLGQQVVFPRGNAYWWWVNKENRLHGRHGGLSREEMLVPFFALEI
jgi:hypothetical protein